MTWTKINKDNEGTWPPEGKVVPVIRKAAKERWSYFFVSIEKIQDVDSGGYYLGWVLDYNGPDEILNGKLVLSCECEECPPEYFHECYWAHHYLSPLPEE